MDRIVRQELDRCRPLIEAALARDGLERFEEVEAAVASGAAQLWPGHSSCFVTRVEDYPTGARVMQAWLSAGELGELVEVQRPMIEGQAREWGCTHALVEGGRPGWQRVLRPHGYAFQGVILLKDLRQ